MVKDGLPMLGVASLVAVDLVILVMYTLVEGIRGKLIAQQVSNRENPMRIEGVRGSLLDQAKVIFFYYLHRTVAL